MIKIKEIMRKKVITVTGDIPIEQACNILVKNKLSGVPVIDKNRKLVGYISEKDIITSLSKKLKHKTTKDVMNKNVFSIKEDTTLDRVSRIFAEKDYRRLPVVKSGKLVGIVSRKDVMSHLVEEYY